MLTKKKKIFMLAGMILLLAVTAYLNFMLAANADSKNDDGLVTTGSFFSQYKTEKQSTRTEEISYLDTIINTTAEEYSEERATAMEQKLKIISIMEKELNIENILKSKGYEEVVVTLGITSDSANIIIKDAELTKEDTAIIYNTVYEQAGTAADNVRIIPVT